MAGKNEEAAEEPREIVIVDGIVEIENGQNNLQLTAKNKQETGL